jgi:hypothetical protein
LGDSPGDPKPHDPAADYRNIHSALSHDPARGCVLLLVIHACGNGL